MFGSPWDYFLLHLSNPYRPDDEVELERMLANKKRLHRSYMQRFLDDTAFFEEMFYDPPLP